MGAYPATNDIGCPSLKVHPASLPTPCVAGADCQFQVIDVQRDDLATLVYTSGTTGNPKGVMLTHGNLLSMMLDFSFHSRSATTVPNDPAPGDIMVSILPCWHIFERVCRAFCIVPCRWSILL